MKKAIPLLVALALTAPLSGLAQVQEMSYIERAKVIQVLSESIRPIAGTDASAEYQTLTAEVLEGSKKGEIVTVENDYLNLAPGDQFYALRTVVDGADSYTVQEPYRLPTLQILGVLFLLTVVVFGGKQGIRGLLSLAASLIVIIFVLIPGVLAGYSPILLSVAVSSFIVIIGSYVTHGFNRTTSAAVVGMIATILITGALAYWSVHSALLSGYSSDEVTYLFFNTGGSIDLVGLLLGGILIGLLGILYDAAIGQAIAIEELKRAAAHYSSLDLYRRGLRIGREHIGALVNTLAIAYVGASLPLLLLLRFSNMSLSSTLNREIFASEIVRTAVGSIGLILAVPVTTLISVWMLRSRPNSET
ncbi:YibE/F family protein [Candidatus Kaiserbacteria bacterium]|nr:YibE/F family protein [Candidatus Kaiserbacteria bacterium]